MDFFRDLKNKLTSYFLKKRILSFGKRKDPIGLAKAQTIGIVFDATEQLNQDAVTNYANALKNNGKKVKLLAFIDSDKEYNSFIFNYFNKKNINWLGIPKGQEVEKFLFNEYDILMNLNSGKEIPLQFVTAESKAGLRVGPVTEHSELYDLMIDTKDNQNLSNFIGQVDYLLKTIE